MPLTEEQAKGYMIKLLTAMTRAGGSYLFVSKDFPPSMKAQGHDAAARDPETDRGEHARAGQFDHERVATRGIRQRARM